MINVQKEEWKPLKINNNYLVSNLGRVKNKNGRLIKASNNGNGYFLISVRLNGKRKNQYIHRIVAELYVPNSQGLDRVNHKDGDKSNNIYSNLEWCSAKQNSRHAVDNGLIKSGFDHFNTTPILDLETGVYYSNVKEAASAKNMVWQTLYTWLRKPHRNRGSLIYV